MTNGPIVRQAFLEKAMGVVDDESPEQRAPNGSTIHIG